VKKFMLMTMALCLCAAVAQPVFAGPGIGQPGQEFGLEDVNGNMQYLSDFDGQVVVLNFWASW